MGNCANSRAGDGATRDTESGLYQIVRDPARLAANELRPEDRLPLYGDIYPMTPEGRLAGAALMILGITLFATITGTITSVLVTERGGQADLVGQLERLAQLHARGVLTDSEFERSKG